MNDEIPNYCVECGSHLTWSEWRFFDYQKSNGLRRFIAKLVCPARRWYQVLHSDPHLGFGHYKRYFYQWGVEFEKGKRIVVVDDDGRPVRQ